MIPKDSKSPLQQRQRMVHKVLKDWGESLAPWGSLISKEQHRVGRSVRGWHSIRMGCAGLGINPAGERHHRWKKAKA